MCICRSSAEVSRQWKMDLHHSTLLLYHHTAPEQLDRVITSNSSLIGGVALKLRMEEFANKVLCLEILE